MLDQLVPISFFGTEQPIQRLHLAGQFVRVIWRSTLSSDAGTRVQPYVQTSPSGRAGF